MIHETLGGGFVGALLIFGAFWVAIVVGATALMIGLGKAVPKLQEKFGKPEGAEGSEAA